MFQYTRLSTRRYFPIVEYSAINTDYVTRNEESGLGTGIDFQKKIL